MWFSSLSGVGNSRLLSKGIRVKLSLAADSYSGNLRLSDILDTVRFPCKKSVYGRIIRSLEGKSDIYER